MLSIQSSGRRVNTHLHGAKIRLQKGATKTQKVKFNSFEAFKCDPTYGSIIISALSFSGTSQSTKSSRFSSFDFCFPFAFSCWPVIASDGRKLGGTCTVPLIVCFGGRRICTGTETAGRCTGDASSSWSEYIEP